MLSINFLYKHLTKVAPYCKTGHMHVHYTLYIYNIHNYIAVYSILGQ